MPPAATKRLLHTRTYELHFDNELEKGVNDEYAIVSHRWLREEITFSTLSNAGLSNPAVRSLSMKKIRGACEKAREHGIDWLWLDSLCINKANSTENETAIKSMFIWYRDAAVCYTYLSDVVFPGAVGLTKPNTGMFEREGQAGRYSEWFERSWTLQELLAPKDMRFFDKDWQFMGTKNHLAIPLGIITRIKVSYLSGSEDIQDANVAAKMSWMAGRKASKIEDVAWSMLGLFNVTTLRPDYGMGAKAFVALEKALIQQFADETIFVWTAPRSGLPKTISNRDWADDEWGLVAPSPDCFRNSGDLLKDNTIRSREACTFSPQGLVLSVPDKEWNQNLNRLYLSQFLFPVAGTLTLALLDAIARRKKEFALTLNCLADDDEGNAKPVQVLLRRKETGMDARHCMFRRYHCSERVLAPKRRRAHYKLLETYTMTVLQPELEN